MSRWLRRFGLFAGTLVLGGCTFVEGIAPAPTKGSYYVCENTYIMGCVSAEIVEYRVDENGKFVRVRAVR